MGILVEQVVAGSDRKAVIEPTKLILRRSANGRARDLSSHHSGLEKSTRRHTNVNFGPLSLLGDKNNKSFSKRAHILIWDDAMSRGPGRDRSRIQKRRKTYVQNVRYSYLGKSTSTNR